VVGFSNGLRPSYGKMLGNPSEYFSPEVSVRVRFADNAFDTEARRVFRSGQEVHLSPKAFDTLTLLVERRGRVVSKKELLDLIWPNVFVSEASLARVVTELRQVLGDDPRSPAIIRTVHGYGYEFKAEVTEEESKRSENVTASTVTCVLISHDRVFPLRDGEHIAGREPALSIWLDSPKVTWRHARLAVLGQRTTIEDLASKNGTYVNGVRIMQPTILQAGDEVRIGPFLLVLRLAGAPSRTETETP
jgi:DNA-binding winged helix-turn-helix (wHTH) protein